MTDSSSLPASARAVIVGAGIVGNSLAYHLARLGWRDLVLIDKGPLPNPGGSTGHASNFIFPVDHSKEMTQLTADSVRQYKEWDVFTESGGIEVARTEERMQELQRRMSSAKAWGIDGCEIITPARVKELVPYIEESVIVGGFYTPGVGIVDSLRFGTIAREKAQELGALQVFANTEVLGIDVAGGRVTGIRTSKGDIATDTIVVCCGVWAPKIARMAGASIPLTPAVHQMIDVGPVPHFKDTKGVIEFPIVRDMDTNMYERQDGSGLEIGSYAHRAILHDPEDIPSNEEAALSPTELPFTQEDFEKQMEDALELIPEVLNDESVGIKYAINGLLSLTPDGLPLLGETPEVKGLWSAAAVWVKEGPGVGKAIAEWMTHGESEIDLQSSDVARFYECQRSRDAHPGARRRRVQQDVRHRAPDRAVGVEPQRSPLAVLRAGAGELGAVFFEAAAWERPHWYESNEKLLEEFGDRINAARGRVGVALVVADHQRRAPRDARARRDVRPDRVLHLRRDRPRRARVRADGLDAPDGRRARQGRLHAGALAERDVQERPDGDAPRRRALPRRHRRRARHGRPEVVRGPRAGEGDDGHRPHRRRGRRSASGGRARATSSRR